MPIYILSESTDCDASNSQTYDLWKSIENKITIGRLIEAPVSNASCSLCLKEIMPKSMIPQDIEKIRLVAVVHLAHLVRCLANSHTMKLGVEPEAHWLPGGM